MKMKSFAALQATIRQVLESVEPGRAVEVRAEIAANPRIKERTEEHLRCSLIQVAFAMDALGYETIEDVMKSLEFPDPAEATLEA